MTARTVAAIIAAVAMMAILPIDRLTAAADKTLGMSVMSARVGASGNLAGGAGAVSAQKVGPQGQYRIAFARELTPTCAATATITGPGASGEQGFIVAEANASGALLVRTYAPNSNFEDRSFSVIVFCHA
ncbi:hypothetical protein [Microbaculum marinum]|uniref:Secreted protein n=1 Tax=Microbaculum marinum TaxID=1764581 RepID=A0AAW9S3F0_9HYPH